MGRDELQKGRTFMSYRIPLDDQYVHLVGKAVYMFSYYEWAIIYLVERLQPGLVKKYCRGKGRMTSGTILKRFGNALDSYTGSDDVDEAHLEECYQKFENLIPKRNALIHAHPITDVDGAQILNYQGNPSQRISDMKWEPSQIVDLMEEINEAACEASDLFHQFPTP